MKATCEAWAVENRFGYEAVRIVSETARTVTVHMKYGTCRRQRGALLATGLTEKAAKDLAAMLEQSRARMIHAQKQAAEQHEARAAKLIEGAIGEHQPQQEARDD